jgi:hypothetical protein
MSKCVLCDELIVSGIVHIDCINDAKDLRQQLQRSEERSRAAAAENTRLRVMVSDFRDIARALVVYRSKNTLNFQLEKADDHIRFLAILVDEADKYLQPRQPETDADEAVAGTG